MVNDTLYKGYNVYKRGSLAPDSTSKIQTQTFNCPYNSLTFVFQQEGVFILKAVKHHKIQQPIQQIESTT